jgi:hypothetical protein
MKEYSRTDNQSLAPNRRRGRSYLTRRLVGYDKSNIADPPAHAVVLSIDEKSQIQALDRMVIRDLERQPSQSKLTLIEPRPRGRERQPGCRGSSATDGGEMVVPGSVHAAGSRFLMASMVRIPAATARSPQRRRADQNIVLHLARQKRCADPPRRARKGRPHHGQHTGEVVMLRTPRASQSSGRAAWWSWRCDLRPTFEQGSVVCRHCLRGRPNTPRGPRYPSAGSIAGHYPAPLLLHAAIGALPPAGRGRLIEMIPE